MLYTDAQSQASLEVGQNSYDISLVGRAYVPTSSSCPRWVVRARILAVAVEGVYFVVLCNPRLRRCGAYGLILLKSVLF